LPPHSMSRVNLPPHFGGWKEERNIQSKFEGPYKIEESRQQSEGICQHLI